MQLDGSWVCDANSLGSNHRQRWYTITGLAGLGACRSAIDVFVTGEDAVFSGEETCTLLDEYSGEISCGVRERCERGSNPDSGIDGTLVWYKVMSCSGDPFDCECPDGDDYRIDGVDHLLACPRVYALCEGTAPEPSGEPVCESTSGVYDNLPENRCWRATPCAVLTEVEPGISSVHAFSMFQYCSQGRGESTSCTCERDGYGFAYEIEVPWVDYDTCDELQPLCADNGAIEYLGPVVCTDGVVSSNETLGVCRTSRSCSQPATLDGQSVVAWAGAQTVCESESDGYACRCDSNSDERFTVSASSAAEACELAAPACPNPPFVRPLSE